ncbi:wall-associated receptor kinase-like 21 [Cynara cardunculus var. scolymus]|uniref:wall-associated receptor kinase-like 21 n=1 Tax=Cynara cardunculus var. scolymus TaxID=59895 RepID=UPI000D630CF8|nr:wall-associated receptor kinase-like 21 [Cynara cardunculus var. scolymus]
MGLMLVIVLVKYVTRKKHQENKSAQFHTQELPITWSGLYRFSKAEIEQAMNFSDEKKWLGRGSAGEVYKGILPSGQAVAIKQISNQNNADSFTREVEGLSRIRHPNLVCLFGCCIEDGEQYLVYEYCPAGNLAHHLLRKYHIPHIIHTTYRYKERSNGNHKYFESMITNFFPRVIHDK